jgi:hypothetical protein
LTKVPTIALRRRAVPRKTRRRITAGERNRGGGSIKRAVAGPQPRWPRVLVPDAESH